MRCLSQKCNFSDQMMKINYTTNLSHYQHIALFSKKIILPTYRTPQLIALFWKFLQHFLCDKLVVECISKKIFVWKLSISKIFLCGTFPHKSVRPLLSKYNIKRHNLNNYLDSIFRRFRSSHLN